MKPKYWCKHCKTYVRDTKLEKTNHEATPKHQGNLKRFLRDLHRGHEKDEKDKERAKAEVARLNGMATGSGSAGNSGMGSSSGLGRRSTASLPKPQATPTQRKQQLAQLAEMGIAIPDEFRPDMAMAGEWQVTSERIIEPEGEKRLDSLAVGVRKREVEEEDEEEVEVKKKRWGSAYRSHPTDENDGELDVLLRNLTNKGNTITPKIEVKVDSGKIKEESGDSIQPINSTFSQVASEEAKETDIKREPLDDAPTPDTIQALDAAVSVEGEGAAPGIIFKKRKAKNIRQK